MKKIILLIISFFFLFNLKVYAQDTAKSSIVMDLDSGRILYQNNINDKRLIASITKIMTSVVAIENKNLNDTITVGDEVLSMYGTNIYLEVGEEITLRDLLYGLMLRSGNDASVVIAKYVGGSIDNFVKLMNEKAKELKMDNTIFENPHGLDEKTRNYSTALDMSKLVRYANNILEFVEIAGTKKWTCTTNKKSYVWYNRDKMITDYKYTTLGKTGYTPKAGKTLVTAASKNNLNLVIVSLDDNNHYESQKYLFDKMFSKYKSTLIIDKNNINFENKQYDNLYVKNSFRYPLTIEEEKEIKTYVNYFNLDKVDNNNVVGEIYVTLNDEEIYRDNIYLKDNKKEKKKKNIFMRIIDFFRI